MSLCINSFLENQFCIITDRDVFPLYKNFLKVFKYYNKTILLYQRKISPIFDVSAVKNDGGDVSYHRQHLLSLLSLVKNNNNNKN